MMTSLCLRNHTVQKRRIWKIQCAGHQLRLLPLSDADEAWQDYAVQLQVDVLEVRPAAQLGREDNTCSNILRPDPVRADHSSRREALALTRSVSPFARTLRLAHHRSIHLPTTKAQTLQTKRTISPCHPQNHARLPEKLSPARLDVLMVLHRYP